jgi:hypothetical protein
MAIRITTPAADTEKLLEQILLPMQEDPSVRVAFLCDSGMGEAVLQRLRVMISRKRAKLTMKGKSPKKFRLRSTVHTETHAGKRFDCVVCWKQITDVHVMSEQLEGILAHG